jgi:glycosyltransferase involved in cell wall biosynthesis
VTDPPRLAVVVATYRRAALLPRLVAALEAQDVGKPFEVVVVDDCSGDETADVLTRLAASARIPLRVVSQPRNRGPAAARNRGWRATGAERIAFTDDDCTPQPGWLAGIDRELDSFDVVQGRTAPDPAQVRAHGPFSRTLDVPAMDGFFQTCNIGYRRSWLERLDGFDEAFRFPMGEDTDLAWRALGAGARATFTGEALVHHDVRPSSVRVQLADTRRWGSVALIVKKHPELRERLYRRWFWKPAHPPAIAAAVGVVLAAVGPSPWLRLLGAASCLPYVKHRVRDAPLPNTGPRRRVVLLPATLLLDLAEVGVLAEASARHRTLVL